MRHASEKLVLEVKQESRLVLLAEAKSGRVGITFKQVRSIYDPDEVGVEILRLRSEKKDIESSFASLLKHLDSEKVLSAKDTHHFVRIDDSNLEAARKIAREYDDRFCSEIYGMKLSHRFKIQDFPSGGINMTVIATLAEWCWRVVPLKIFHVSELAVVMVGLDTGPFRYYIPTSHGHLLVNKLEKKGLKAKGKAFRESASSAGSVRFSEIS